MRIGILGTGRAAHALAAKWTTAGHSITLGSRDPANSKETAYPVVTSAEAVASTDITVNVTPGSASLDLIGGIGPDTFRGRTLLDIANPVDRAGRLVYPESSLAERLQRLLPDAHVVKALNTVNIAVMTNPGSVPPSVVFMSGDDEQAKATVAGLVHDLGWPTDSLIDLGGIGTARGPEHYFVHFLTVMRALGTLEYNIAIVK